LEWSPAAAISSCSRLMIIFLIAAKSLAEIHGRFLGLPGPRFAVVVVFRRRPGPRYFAVFLAADLGDSFAAELEFIAISVAIVLFATNTPGILYYCSQ
jgi:hypothetical protein